MELATSSEGRSSADLFSISAWLFYLCCLNHIFTKRVCCCQCNTSRLFPELFSDSEIIYAKRRVSALKLISGRTKVSEKICCIIIFELVAKEGISVKDQRLAFKSIWLRCFLTDAHVFLYVQL